MPDKDEVLVAKQQEFIEWLKVHNMYSPHESSNAMFSMFQVWTTMNEDLNNCRKVIARLTK